MGAELRPRGYRGSDPTVARSTQRLRQARGGTPPAPEGQAPGGGPCIRQPPLTARRGRGWGGDVEAERTAGESQPRPRGAPSRAHSADALALTADVAPLVRQRPGAPLEPWCGARRTAYAWVLQRLLQGRRDDDAAVKAGMTLSWSTGPVEGHMNASKAETPRCRTGTARSPQPPLPARPTPVRRGPSHARRHPWRHRTARRCLGTCITTAVTGTGPSVTATGRERGVGESTARGERRTLFPLRRSSISCGTCFTKSGQEPTLL